AQAVAVEHLSLEQIGDGRESDVGMGPHVEPGASAEHGRSELVEEDEGPDHAPRGDWQDTMDLEAVSQILASRLDDHLDRGGLRGARLGRGLVHLESPPLVWWRRAALAILRSRNRRGAGNSSTKRRAAGRGRDHAA